MDGWGYRKNSNNNAVALAKTPNFDRFCNQYPMSFLAASGPDVGLPQGQVGNSEVGHMNIGAGRVVMQDLPRINAAAADGSLQAHPELAAIATKLLANGGTAHVMGLLSEGGVHSHEDHMMAIIKGLCGHGVPVNVHGFSDGRDVLPKVAGKTIPAFADNLCAGASMATLCGRYYAMDRDQRWDRIELVFDAIVNPSPSRPRFTNALAAITDAYDNGETDEFIKPRLIGDYAGMRDGDAIIFINFRADRARQLLDAFLRPRDVGFVAHPPTLAGAIGMSTYSDMLAPHMTTLFPPQILTRTLGEVVADAGKTQLRLAETEKYPHVTFFFNGGAEAVLPGEERCMIQSPKVATYDLQPEMSADGVLAAALDSIRSGTHDLLIMNFANPDMVGHTGNLDAAIIAVETVDAAIGEIEACLKVAKGQMLLTADHGNCEIMWDDDGDSPHTAHTTNLVPLLLINGGGYRVVDGRLADLAPTLLAMLDIAQPSEMTGTSLLQPV